MLSTRRIRPKRLMRGRMNSRTDRQGRDPAVVDRLEGVVHGYSGGNGQCIGMYMQFRHITPAFLRSAGKIVIYITYAGLIKIDEIIRAATDYGLAAEASVWRANIYPSLAARHMQQREVAGLVCSRHEGGIVSIRDCRISDWIAF